MVVGFNTSSVCPLLALRRVAHLPRFVFYECHMTFELDRAYTTFTMGPTTKTESAMIHRFLDIGCVKEKDMFRCMECNQMCPVPRSVTCGVFHLSGPKQISKEHHSKVCGLLQTFKPRPGSAFVFSVMLRTSSLPGQVCFAGARSGR